MKRSARFGSSLALAAAVLMVFLCVSRSSSGLSAADWPQFRGPRNDLTSTESVWTAAFPASGPKILWKVEVGKGFSTASVVGKRVYTMGNISDEDVVWCIDADTGKVLWTHRYDCTGKLKEQSQYPGTRATPTVDGDSVYTLSREGHLFALEAKSGKVRWSRDITKDFGAHQTQHDWGFSCSPLVLGDRLILDVGKSLSLDKETGSLVWASGDDAAGFSTPTTIDVGGKTYINGFTAHGLVLVSAADGKELARVEWETSYSVNAASPIPSGNKIFISSGYGKGCGLFELAGATLEPLYESRAMRNHSNGCVLYKGHIYGIDGQMGDRRGALKCLDWETGEVKWEEKGVPPGGLIVADGKIVAMVDKGDLLIAEASPGGFKQLARGKVLDDKCWTIPVLSGGRIYCRGNLEGGLVCVDVSGK